jgi:hypothetical protein
MDKVLHHLIDKYSRILPLGEFTDHLQCAFLEDASRRVVRVAQYNHFYSAILISVRNTIVRVAHIPQIPDRDRYTLAP